jgi:hypothetical protein
VTSKRITRTCLAALAGALALLGGGTAANAAPLALSCSGQTYVQPFLPWLDPANYVLMSGGALETTDGWTLSGGAALVSGNEPFRVNGASDGHSLLLPAGSSATSPTLCITLLHPTLRFFALNSGRATSALKVEAVTAAAGVEVTTPIGLLLANGSWRPTVPLAFFDNLISPVADSVAFRFTPLGAGSGWQIDDVYVDPYKQG